MTAAKYLFIVSMDVAPEKDALFNEVYDVEHIPALLKVPGVRSIVAVVIGAVLLDCGLRAAMVANQTMVNAAVPDSRSRANTLFGLHVWSGNALGAFLMSWAFAQFGWLAVCGVALTATVIALLIHLRIFPVEKTKTTT